MDRALREPIAPQAQIITTCFPDMDEQRRRVSNATRLSSKADLYPNANDPQAFVIEQGQLILGRRNNIATNDEFGFSSLSGCLMSDLERQQRELYFVGIALAEANQYMGSDVSREGGFSVVKSGTISTINDGPHGFNPGELVAWRFPKANEMKQQHGTSKSQTQPILVPFHKLDTNTNVELCLSALKFNDDSVGVRGVSYEQYQMQKESFSPVQEEALGLYYGELFKMANVLNSMIAFARKDADLDADRVAEAANAFIAEIIGDSDVFGAVLLPGKGKLPNALDLSGSTAAYAKYGHLGFYIAQDSRDSAFMARRELIIGRAMSSAKAYGSTLDVMLRLS